MSTPGLPTAKPTATIAKTSLALGLAAALGACASVPAPSPEDPWESYNRSAHAFNEAIDGVFLKPIATAYETITPQPVRSCVHNVFGNLEDVWSGVNSLLQGRGRDFVDTFGRVLFNSTVGVGGCIDVASMNGAQKIPNDLGMTLGVWGLGNGPYFVIPFVGPSSLRDSSAMAVGLATGVSPSGALFEINNIPVRNSVFGLYLIDTRAGLLQADRLVEQIALDKYSFIRDAYLQRRNSMLQSRRSSQHASTSNDLASPADDLPVYDDPQD